MLRFLEGIFTNAPIWVWPLLVFLIWIGLLATKDRESSIYAYLPLPFFVLMTINNMRDVASPDIVWPAFGLAYFLGLWAGDRFQQTVIMRRTRRRVAVKGEWVTLATIMGVYWLNFANGAANVIEPALVVNPIYIGCRAALSGALSGQFAGRTLRVLRAPVSVSA